MEQWFTFGVPTAILAAIGFGAWKLVHKFGDKTYQLGERYVSSNESLTGTLRESVDKQQALCQAHVTTLATVVESVEAKDAANRRVVLTACDVCQSITAKHFPSAASDVANGCAEIKRAIGEA